MGALLSLIPLIKGAAGAVWDWYKGRQEVQQQALEVRKQVQLQKVQDAGRLELAAMETRHNLIVGCVMLLWSVPLVQSYIDPASASHLGAALAALPEWYVNTYIAITGAAVGLPLLRR